MVRLSILALLMLIGPAALRAEEPKCKTEMAILTKIPYLNRLFKTVRAPDAVCVECEECVEMVERIGVDFDFNIEEAPPKSKRERRERAEQEKRELTNALVEALVENAELKARLEFAEERAELVAEITRLKADLQAAQSGTTPSVAKHRTNLPTPSEPARR